MVIYGTDSFTHSLAQSLTNSLTHARTFFRFFEDHLTPIAVLFVCSSLVPAGSFCATNVHWYRMLHPPVTCIQLSRISKTSLRYSIAPLFANWRVPRNLLLVHRTSRAAQHRFLRGLIRISALNREYVFPPLSMCV